VLNDPDVLVVDDEAAIRDALRRGLTFEGFRVRTASGGWAAVQAVTRQEPDVLVLDVGMPDLDGVRVIRRLRGDGFDVPICVLSARREVEDRVAGLQAGADDYLVKPFHLDELVARLHALLRRRPEHTGAPLTVGDLRLDPAGRAARRGTRDLVLTRREFDLLETFARHPGIVLSRPQLLSMVWGYDFEVDGNVVDVFVGYLRRKLEEGGEPRVLQTVRGIGFTLRASR
jgi:DNA-binding response OmpR family regulator